MTYSSVEYLFYLLSAIVCISFFKKSLKIHFLLLASLIWIASWNFIWPFIFLGISITNFSLLKLFENLIGPIRNRCFQFLLILNVFIFTILKSGQIVAFRFETPYGISFYTAILLAYIIDLWRTEKPFKLDRISEFMMLPIFFPILMGGPILRRNEFLSGLRTNLKISFEDFTDGVLIFALGFYKIYFISTSLKEIRKVYFNNMSVDNIYILIILGLFSTFHAYIDLSGFCDMGRGAARCFGFHFPVNFRPFYFAKNPNDFWQRWNITLGLWIRDYFSFPMMLKFGRKIGQNSILLLGFTLMGLWHGLSVNWFLFGIFNGLLIVFHNWISTKSRVRLIGYIFSMVLFIGNGLLQDLNWVPKVKEYILQPSFTNFLYFYWKYSFNSISTSFIFLVLTILFFEFIQETKNDIDWYLKIETKIKRIVLVSIFVWFFYSLNENMFLDSTILPPPYFRI